MSDNKSALLEEVSRQIETLTASPLYTYRIKNNYLHVPGEGNSDANIVFIGEAPGKNEAISGKPFCGAAGKVLDKLLRSAQINREDVFITNIVKDRPPNNRDPKKEEIELYAPLLIRQLEVIQPRIIATLGRFSMYFILESFKGKTYTETISQLRGTFIPVDTPWGPSSILPLFHPAVAMYNPKQYVHMESDFKAIKKALVSFI